MAIFKSRFSINDYCIAVLSSEQTNHLIQSKMSRHRLEGFEGGDLFECKICDITFSGKGHFKRHITMKERSLSNVKFVTMLALKKVI